MISPRRDIDKNLRGQRCPKFSRFKIFVIWYQFIITQQTIDIQGALGMRLRLKNRRLRKSPIFVTPGKIRYRRVSLDHVDSSCLFLQRFYRGQPRITTDNHGFYHDEWYIDRLNHLLIELAHFFFAQFKAKLLKMKRDG